MKDNFKFTTMAEVEIFEYKNPGVLETNPEANKAARTVFEEALISARKKFLKVSQKEIEAMSLCCVPEGLTEILGIEKWLEMHPSLITAVKNEEIAELERDLAHAKKSFYRNLRAVPGSIVFISANKSLRKVAEIEQKLGKF